MKKGIWIRPGGCNLAGWLRTEKRNDNDNCTSRKDYDCRVKIDYQKRFLGNRGSGGICEAGFPGQRTNHPASCHRRTESEKKDNSSQLSTPETSRCNMPLRNRHTKRLRHKWNVTNGSSPGKRSPCRNMKSASPTSRRRSLNTNYLPTICATPRRQAPFDGSIEKRLVENYQRVNSGEGIVRACQYTQSAYQIHHSGCVSLFVTRQRPAFPRRVRHI